MTTKPDQLSPSCAHCGFQPPTEALFCPKCGEAINKDAPKTIQATTPEETIALSSTVDPKPSGIPDGATRQMTPLSTDAFQDMVDAIQGSESSLSINDKKVRAALPTGELDITFPTKPKESNVFSPETSEAEEVAPLPPPAPIPLAPAEDSNATALLGPEVRSRVEMMVREAQAKKAVILEQASETPEADPTEVAKREPEAGQNQTMPDTSQTLQMGPEIVAQIKAAVEDKQRQAPRAPTKTASHSAAQLSEFSFSSIAKVVKKLQDGKTDTKTEEAESQDISTKELRKKEEDAAIEKEERASSPKPRRETDALSAYIEPPKGCSPNTESQDGLPFFTSDQASFSPASSADSTEIAVKQISNETKAYSVPDGLLLPSHSESSQTSPSPRERPSKEQPSPQPKPFVEANQPTPLPFFEAGQHSPQETSSVDASSTMVMDRENIQQWIQEMGISLDSETEAQIDDATETLAQAEKAVDQGDIKIAIDLYLSLVRAFPQESQYQERLTSLWEEVRHNSTEESLPIQPNNNRWMTILLGCAFLLVVLGWIWPGWFRTSPSENKTTAAQRTKQTVASIPRKVTAPKPATMQINSTPSGATIWLNGKQTKKTTPAKLHRPGGRYVLILRLKEYRDLKINITLQAGQLFCGNWRRWPLGLCH